MASVVALPGPPPHSISSLNAHVEDGLLVGNATDSSNVPRGPVKTSVNFFKHPSDGSTPFNYVEKQPEGQPQNNFEFQPEEIEIRDVRGKESTIDLDAHAFLPLQGWAHNPEIDWDDDESIKKNYYPEVERILLTQIPGTPNRVVIFDHTVRRAGPNAHRTPVTRAHIDQTAKSAKHRIYRHCPEDADKLAEGRYRLINVWRPLNGAVESHPLAFASSQTVPNEDVVPVEHRYPTWTGETAGVQFNPNHQWNYWSGMTNDERLLLQCFDSKAPGTRVPHTAFVDPRSTEESKPRESIEVRALIFG